MIEQDEGMIPRCICKIEVVDGDDGQPVFKSGKRNDDCEMHEVLDALLAEGDHEAAMVLVRHETKRIYDDYLRRRRRTAPKPRRSHNSKNLTHRPFAAALKK